MVLMYQGGQMDLNEFDSEEIEVKESFKIDDDSKATWAMRKLKVHVVQMAINNSIAEDEKKRIDEWLETVNNPIQTKSEFFTNHLVAYGKEQREQFDRKTVSTPYGKISSRQSQEKFEFTDKDIFLKFCENQSLDLVRYKVEPDMEKIKTELVVTTDGKIITKDSEMIPGIAIKPSEINYKVEVE